MCGHVGKAIGRVFGIGGSSTPSVQQADPVATTVNVGDDTGTTGEDEATKKAKKKKGFSSTQLNDWRSGLSSILGGENNDKNTLG